MAEAVADGKSGKVVITNIGLLLSGDIDRPILDADTIVAGANSASSRNSRIDPTRKCSDHTHVSGPGVVGVLPLERLGPVLPA